MPTASEVGFCVMDSNADCIARNMIERLAEDASTDESLLNRLYRGREAYTLSLGEKEALVRVSKRYEYMALTVLEILAAQRGNHLQAAE